MSTFAFSHRHDRLTHESLLTTSRVAGLPAQWGSPMLYITFQTRKEVRTKKVKTQQSLEEQRPVLLPFFVVPWLGKSEQALYSLSSTCKERW